MTTAVATGLLQDAQFDIRQAESHLVVAETVPADLRVTAIRIAANFAIAASLKLDKFSKQIEETNFQPNGN